jgi:hypothetical protein
MGKTYSSAQTLRPGAAIVKPLNLTNFCRLLEFEHIWTGNQEVRTRRIIADLSAELLPELSQFSSGLDINKPGEHFPDPRSKPAKPEGRIMETNVPLDRPNR